jgi:hypothetical protein
VNHPARLVRGLLFAGLGALLVLSALAFADDGDAEPPWVRNRRAAQDLAGGLPKAILDQQRIEKVEVPALDEAARLALAAARTCADEVIDSTWHTGHRLHVPKDHATIQAAIDEARPRDVVVVSPGTYYELLVMKAGVQLVSDASDGGDELVAVEGAMLKLPRRALRTVIDGSKSEPSSHGLIDFEPGTTRHTIVDGFTLQKLPHQNHHVPGHAHGLNVRGASPVIMHCLLQDNGSTGIGNHVVYRDQGQPIAGRDFRHANVQHKAEAVIFGNIVRRNLGRGIGCNHFSAPLILGNEVYANDDAELGEGTGPGIGMKHGAAPRVLGNLVHDNPGGGIICRAGDPQGAHPIDRPTQPVYERNVAWNNGTERPCIGAATSGSRSAPVRIIGNWVFDAGGVGIGVRDGGWSVIVGNLVARTTRPGISIFNANALELDANRIAHSKDAGIAIVSGARVIQMKDNVAHEVDGPRFVLRDARVGPEDAKAPASDGAR